MIRRKLLENFAHPRGLWGRLAGQVMARKTANVERGKWALAELDPGPDDRVLEVGYGPGLSLSDACRRVCRGHGATPSRSARDASSCASVRTVHLDPPAVMVIGRRS